MKTTEELRAYYVARWRDPEKRAAALETQRKRRAREKETRRKLREAADREARLIK